MQSWTTQRIWQTWIAHSIAELKAHEAALNAMNVFPVPDADTGSNMLHTLEAASSDSLYQGLEATLKASRGNSGTLLAVWFTTLIRSLGEDGIWTPEALHFALFEAWRAAERSMSKPAPGTILTCMEVAARAPLHGEIDEHVPHLASLVADAAFATQSQQEQARRAQTYDAGAVGFVLIWNALCQAMQLTGLDEERVSELFLTRSLVSSEVGEAENGVEVQCTVSISVEDMTALRSLLDASGSSLVIAPVDSLNQEKPTWKIHVHVEKQEQALKLIRKYAEPTAIAVTSLAGDQQ